MANYSDKFKHEPINFHRWQSLISATESDQSLVPHIPIKISYQACKERESYSNVRFTSIKFPFSDIEKVIVKIGGVKITGAISLFENPVFELKIFFNIDVFEKNYFQSLDLMKVEVYKDINFDAMDEVGDYCFHKLTLFDCEYRDDWCIYPKYIISSAHTSLHYDNLNYDRVKKVILEFSDLNKVFNEHQNFSVNCIKFDAKVEGLWVKREDLKGIRNNHKDINKKFMIKITFSKATEDLEFLSDIIKRIQQCFSFLTLSEIQIKKIHILDPVTNNDYSEKICYLNSIIKLKNNFEINKPLISGTVILNNLENIFNGSFFNEKEILDFWPFFFLAFI